jgi:hypothetical protein
MHRLVLPFWIIKSTDTTKSVLYNQVLRKNDYTNVPQFYFIRTITIVLEFGVLFVRDGFVCLILRHFTKSLTFVCIVLKNIVICDNKLFSSMTYGEQWY